MWSRRLQQTAQHLRAINQPYSTESQSVHSRKVQSIRHFIFDRPKALNALNLDMIYTMTPQLRAWQDSDLCKVIVVSSKPESKAFCAGGDVKNIVITAKSQTKESLAKAAKFFEEEYKLNHLIATSKKPFVSILNGITMGGGVGISVHGQFRIVTENTLIAMPETSIGLFPDVGGSFFLPRLDGELGTFLGLTGHRLKGEDAYIAGFGTHFVPASRLNGLMERLKELETDELDVVNGIIDEFSGKALFNLGTISKEKFSNWQLGGKIGEMIDRVFKFDTIEEILVSLAKECSSGDADIAKFATTQHEILKSVSPTSLKVTLEQIRRGAKMDIASCFRMEYQMVKEFLTTPDFDEGVTAKLIEKRSPVWKPSFEKIQSILKSDIETKYFLPTGPKLELLNRLSYYDYPHRTLSGLPTDRDVKRVVNGEGRRGAVTMKPRTRKEVLDWILQNWGRYDTGVIGYSDQNMPTRNTLDGGYGRGKIGLLEKVQAILELHTVETDSGLNWK